MAGVAIDTDTEGLEPLGPIAQADGPDAPWLIDEAVPGAAASFDDIVVAEHPIGGPVIAHELTDVLHDIQLGGSKNLAVRLDF